MVRRMIPSPIALLLYHGAKGKAILEKRFPGSKQPISEPGKSLGCASIYSRGDSFRNTTGSATLKQHSLVQRVRISETREVGMIAKSIRRKEILSGSGRKRKNFR